MSSTVGDPPVGWSPLFSGCHTLPDWGPTALTGGLANTRWLDLDSFSALGWGEGSVLSDLGFCLWVYLSLVLVVGFMHLEWALISQNQRMFPVDLCAGSCPLVLRRAFDLPSPPTLPAHWPSRVSPGPILFFFFLTTSWEAFHCFYAQARLPFL